MKTIYTLLFLSLCLGSCSKSVLSDMEITDPHLLKVKVKVEQNGDNEREVQVYIRDKNNKPIDLMTGRVVVNDHAALFDRAEVNALGARGYMYYPYSDEHIFKITIYWNSYDSHTFILSPDNGWPGFRNYDYCSCSNHHEPSYASDTYTLRPAPFHNHEIDVSYRIVHRW